MSDRGLNSADTSRPSVRHAVALGLVLLSVTIAGAALGGVTAAESQSGPIEISDWTDLDDIRNSPGADYVLVNDLDETTPGYDMVAGPNANGARGFDPIGEFLDGFSGSFDGQGNSIANLTIDRPTEDQGVVGLFGSTSGGAVIEEVTLTSATVNGYRGVGGLVGVNEGTVSNSSASGVVAGFDDVGGLIGDNYGTVSTSSASGAVNGSSGVGGLVGYNSGDVSTSSASGAVNGTNEVGGLVGDNGGTVSTSSASGAVTGSSNVGGLVGLNEGTVSTSSASGAVSGTGEFGGVGGLVGENRGTVSNSSASGAVSGTGEIGSVGGLAGYNGGDVSTSSASGAVNGSIQVGGLVGLNEGTVSTSSASGAVTGSSRVGGLVGQNYQGTVSESFATGAVTGSTDVGGLVGKNSVGENSGTVTGAYWDIQVTGQIQSAGGIGLNTSQMKGASAAQNMRALDFTSTWQTVTDPAGYPELQAGPPPTAERGPDIEDTDSDDDGGDGFGPGFGPGVVLAGLSGAGYLLKRRGTTTDTDAN